MAVEGREFNIEEYANQPGWPEDFFPNRYGWNAYCEMAE